MPGVNVSEVIEEVLAGDAVGDAEGAAFVAQYRGGEGVNRSTVYRWRTIGNLVNGRVVKLESVTLGGRTLTSRRAIARFIIACSEGGC